MAGKPGRPRKPFDELSDSSKRRRQTPGAEERNRIGVDARISAKKQLVRFVKHTLGCEVCAVEGRYTTNSLHFHHVDPADKLFEISKGISTAGWEALIDEMAKCVVLCREHHTDIHARLRANARDNFKRAA